MSPFIEPGWYLHWQGHTYQVVALDAVEQRLEAELLHTGERISLPFKQVFSSEAGTSVSFAPTVEGLLPLAKALSVMDTRELPEPLQRRAAQILTTVEMVEALVAEAQRRALRTGQSFRRTPSLCQALASLTPPLSLAAFYKQRRLYVQAEGSLSQLAAGLHRSSFQKTKCNPVQLHLVDTLILRYYGRSRPLRPLTVYQLGQSVLTRTENRWLDPKRGNPPEQATLVEELLDPHVPMQALLANPDKVALLSPAQLPSRSWFYAYLKWFEAQPEQGKTVITRRYGVGVWEQTYALFDTFVSRASAPLQYVFADHWLLDVFTVDEASRSQVSRLWLTTLIDAYSRSILGLALLDEYPSTMSIQSALLHAIWPKSSHQAVNVPGDWVCFGIPQQLYLDNAWAHHSHSLEDLSRTISRQGRYSSIDLVFRPPYRGRYGALIERFFGNLSSQVKALLPGAVPSGSRPPRGQAAVQACLLYQDVYRLLHQLILRYQHTVHGELRGLTPHEKWLEGLGQATPLIPALTAEVARLFWRLEPETRVLTSKGLSAFGLHYWSADWAGVERVGHDGQPIHYRFRYDPTDISQIALFREGHWLGDGQAKELRQANGRVQSLSLAERQLAQQLARGAGNAALDWLHFVHEVDTLTDLRQREKRQIQRTRPTASATVLPHLLSETGADYTDLLAQFTGQTPSSGDGQ